MDYWTLVEPHWTRVSLVDADSFLRDFSAMPEAARHLLCAHWLYSEVCNGGFHQFFTNPTGVLAPEAVDGLRALGLGDLAAIAAEALRFFPTPYPREQDTRSALLDAFADQSTPGDQDDESWSPFSPLDDRFYDGLQLGGPGEDRFVEAANAYAERN